MDDNNYYRGRYEEVTTYRNQLVEELHKWKIVQNYRFTKV